MKIFIALVLVPASFPVFSVIFYLPMGIDSPNIYQNGTNLEKMWQKEAKKLAGRH